MRVLIVRVQDWPLKSYRVPIQKREAACVGAAVVVDSPRHGYVIGRVMELSDSPDYETMPWIVDVVDDTAYNQLSAQTPEAVIDHRDYDENELNHEENDE